MCRCLQSYKVRSCWNWANAVANSLRIHTYNCNADNKANDLLLFFSNGVRTMREIPFLDAHSVHKLPQTAVPKTKTQLFTVVCSNYSQGHGEYPQTPHMTAKTNKAMQHEILKCFRAHFTTELDHLSSSVTKAIKDQRPASCENVTKLT